MVAGRIDTTGGYDSDERRIFGRVPMQMTVDAWRLDHRLDARRQPRVQVAVKDVSLNGMQGLSDAPVEAGEHISVRFGPRNGMPMWDAYGRVVRCEADRAGYRVAVEFDPLPAA
jgi:hypothetical protein